MNLAGTYLTTARSSGMPESPKLTLEEIKSWVDQPKERGRDWLAAKLGVSAGTVANWFAVKNPRPIPEPTLRLIARLMADDLLGRPQYTIEETILIRRAMDQEGYVKLADFMRDSVLANASKLINTPAPTVAPALRVAEEPAEHHAFRLPFLGAVAAGEPVEAPRNETLAVSKQYPDGHFIVEVNGQSAEPDYPDGSRWVIDGRDKYTPKDGAVCVVSDGSGSYLKRWNRKRGVFESVNPRFKDVLPSNDAKLQGYPVERVS